MKTDNQIISDARGECRHANKEDYVADNRAAMHRCPDCRISWHWSESIDFTAPDYSTDLSAWTPELFKWVEDERLDVRFAKLLSEWAEGVYRLSGPFPYKHMFTLLRFTPAQKASALAQAIKERDQ